MSAAGGMAALPGLGEGERHLGLSPFLHALYEWRGHQRCTAVPASGVAADLAALLQSFALQRVRRFSWQVHWKKESARASLADWMEPGLKLENVAAHSWHVADAVLLLAGHFGDLDAARCLALAVIHDKLEIFTGDYDPVGTDGRGTGTHAFDSTANEMKRASERSAARGYLEGLRPNARRAQADLLKEAIDGQSAEISFVRAVDKLQALAFVVEKKAGSITTEHLLFTARYSSKAVAYFPRLCCHYAGLLGMLLDKAAAARGTSRAELEAALLAEFRE